MNLNSIVNNPQISSNAAAEKEIKGSRLHSGRKSVSVSKYLIDITTCTKCI